MHISPTRTGRTEHTARVTRLKTPVSARCVPSAPRPALAHPSSPAERTCNRCHQQRPAENSARRGPQGRGRSLTRLWAPRFSSVVSLLPYKARPSRLEAAHRGSVPPFLLRQPSPSTACEPVLLFGCPFAERLLIASETQKRRSTDKLELWQLTAL